MEVIPVLDITGGKAVAGKSGRRWEYRELKTVYTDSSDPVEIARALPHDRLYVADLDGITDGKPDYPLLERLGDMKKLMVDLGIRDYGDYRQAKALGAEIVAATETLSDDESLSRIIREGCVVSIDMKDGIVLQHGSRFETPSDAFNHFIDQGADRFIFLDISAVGTLAGNRFGFLGDMDTNGVEVMVGGGIVSEDIPLLEKLGVDAVLVGTALHKGLL